MKKSRKDYDAKFKAKVALQPAFTSSSCAGEFWPSESGLTAPGDLRFWSASPERPSVSSDSKVSPPAISSCSASAASPTWLPGPSWNPLFPSTARWKYRALGRKRKKKFLLFLRNSHKYWLLRFKNRGRKVWKNSRKRFVFRDFFVSLHSQKWSEKHPTSWASMF